MPMMERKVAMDKAKREKLEANGWKAGTVEDFLELTPEEAALIEIKLALSRILRQRRQERMTQAELAEKLHSSQPRIAKAEGGIVLSRLNCSCEQC